MRRLHRAAQVAVHLQLRGEVVTQADARGVVPVMLAERRLALLGQAQTTGLTMEQRVTQVLLQTGNLPADRPLGDM